MKCVVTPSRIKDETLAAVQVVVVEPHEQNPVVEEEQRDVHNVTGDKSAENRVSSHDFYVYNAGSTDGQNTVELGIEDKLVNVVIDSGASFNLMSEETFSFIT